MLSTEERQQVLALARRSVELAAAGRPVEAPPEDGIFARRSGAFVSLHHHGDLRGCIGHIDASQSLAQVVSGCAAAAAVEDPRFPPVRPAEVAALDIEVSVLAPLERVTDPATIEVGRDGLVIQQGWRKGLLLPQVATEHRWDRETFLAQTCRKAGLPMDAWRHGAEIFRFEAEVFGE
jgi:AmmeMemoRadiSam system protein A